MPDTLTQFNLDDLTVDPTDFRGQAEDTNTALRDVAKNRAAQYGSMLDTVEALGDLSVDTAVANERRAIEGAQQLDRLYWEAENFLEDIQEIQDGFQPELTDLSAQALELVQERSSGGLNIFGKLRNQVQTNYLAKRYQEVNQFNQNLNQQKHTYMNSVQVQTDRIRNHVLVKNQAERDIDNFSQSLELENKIKQIRLALEGDDQVLGLIERRATIDPNSIAQEERDGLETFEMLHMLQHGSLEGFGKDSSRNLQGIYSELDKQDREGIQWATFEYGRAKAAGVELTPRDLISLAMQNSDIHTVETLSKFYEDPGLYESIQAGRQELIQREYDRIFAYASQDRPPEAGEFSDAEIRSMQQQAHEAVQGMTSRQLFGAMQNNIVSDVQNFISGQGTLMFSRVAENAGDLVSDRYPLVQQYLNSDQGRLALSNPNVADGNGQLSVLDSLVSDMRSQRIPDNQIFGGLSEFTNAAAKASYTEGSEFGVGTKARQLNELETFGMDFSDNLVILPSPRDGISGVRSNIAYTSSPSDLQKSVEVLGAFRRNREALLRGEHFPTRESILAQQSSPSNLPDRYSQPSASGILGRIESAERRRPLDRAIENL